MKSKFMIAALIATTAGGAGRATAQDSRAWAQEIARQYAAGTSNIALEHTRWPCPRSDEKRNYLLEELQKLELDQLQVQELAQNWNYARSKCADSRLDRWYRIELNTATNPYTVLSLGRALGATRSAEDIAVLKSAIMREDVPEDIRGQLAASAKAFTPAEKIGWIAEGTALGKKAPIEFLTTEYMRVPPADLAHVRSTLLKAVKKGAFSPHSTDVLAILAGDADRSSDAAWRSAFRKTLREIAALPSAHSSVRSAARSAENLIRD